MSVTPKKEFWINLFAECATLRISKERVRRRLGGISHETADRLLAGEKLMPNKIQQVFDGLKKNFGEPQLKYLRDVTYVDITEVPEEQRIPSGFDYLASLSLGCYIDNFRGGGDGRGLPLWYLEKLSLSPDIEGSEDGRERLTGTLVNEFATVFDVVLKRVNLHQVCLAAHSRPTVEGNPASQESFHASFSWCLDGALCGIWTGIDHLQHKMTAYQMILFPNDHEFSEDRPSIDQLQELSKTARLKVVDKANSWGNQFGSNGTASSMRWAAILDQS